MIKGVKYEMPDICTVLRERLVIKGYRTEIRDTTISVCSKEYDGRAPEIIKGNTHVFVGDSVEDAAEAVWKFCEFPPEILEECLLVRQLQHLEQSLGAMYPT